MLRIFSRIIALICAGSRSASTETHVLIGRDDLVGDQRLGVLGLFVPKRRPMALPRRADEFA